MPQQLEHHQNRFQHRKFPVTIVCDGLSSASNTGSLFRIADAFGVEAIIFCVYVPVFSRRMEKTARATHKTVAHSFEPETETALKTLKEEGYTIIALEITDNSTPLQHLSLEPHEKIALLLGGENHGIAPQHLALANHIVHIDMYGNNSSMNVSVAAGICLQTITQQIK